MPEKVNGLKERLVNYYKGVDPNYDFESYPLNLCENTVKKFGNPLITKELKKLGYL